MYNPSKLEPDLIQLITESISKSIVFDIPELVFSGTQIIEIESDDEESETSDQKKASYSLFTLSSTEISLSLSRENSKTFFKLFEPRTFTFEMLINLPPLQIIVLHANKILSTFDVANILSKKIGRTR